VLLTLSDERFAEGRVGFYTESARLRVHGLALDTLECPQDEPYTTHSAEGGGAPGADD